jgi:hypothetical protein
MQALLMTGPKQLLGPDGPPPPLVQVIGATMQQPLLVLLHGMPPIVTIITGIMLLQVVEEEEEEEEGLMIGLVEEVVIGEEGLMRHQPPVVLQQRLRLTALVMAEGMETPLLRRTVIPQCLRLRMEGAMVTQQLVVHQPPLTVQPPPRPMLMEAPMPMVGGEGVRGMGIPPMRMALPVDTIIVEGGMLVHLPRDSILHTQPLQRSPRLQQPTHLID